jgi:hypothetical protein
MDNQILPQIDLAVLQQKTNEAAMKGAISCIEDFYNSYNSPFKKKVSQALEEKGADSIHFTLPDIMGLINDSLSKEIDIIANNAVAQSFIPLVSKFMTRADKEVNFSELLKKFIESYEPEDKYECSVDIEENSRHRWLDVTIKHNKTEQKFTLHKDHAAEKLGLKRYQIMSLPYQRGSSQNMKLKVGNGENSATLELPFTPDVLANEFLSFVARLIIAGSIITMDCEEFDEEWFHDEDGCHCH